MINIAVVGAGNWGKNLVRAFSGLENAKLHTCCDLNVELLRNLRKTYPLTNFTSELKDVLNNREIDGVVVASSAATHFEIAKAVLSSGKHVFVEKPLCLNEKHVLELIELSGKRSLKLLVGHLLLYHPAVRLAKKIIEEKKLGDVLYAYSQRLNLGVVRTQENALWSLAPHDISVILYLFGEEPHSVSCRGGAYLQKKENVEDVIFLNINFKSGRIGHIHASWLDPNKARRTTVIGTKKMLVFDDMEVKDKVRVYDKGADITIPDLRKFSLRDGGCETPEVSAEEPLKLECGHFVRCIKNGDKPFTDGHNGLEVVRVLCAAEKSLKNSGVTERIKK